MSASIRAPRSGRNRDAAGELDAAALTTIADEIARLLASGGEIAVDLSAATLVETAETFAGA